MTEQAAPSMVERVALALWRLRESRLPSRVRRPTPDIIDMQSGAFALVCEDARAAIAAMREPTPSMVDAAKGALKVYIDGLPAEERERRGPRHPGDYPGYRVSAPIKYRLRYQAMIDAAEKG